MREMILFGSVGLSCSVYLYFFVNLFRRDKNKSLNELLYFISIIIDMYVSTMTLGSIPFFAVSASIITVVHGGIEEALLLEI